MPPPLSACEILMDLFLPSFFSATSYLLGMVMSLLEREIVAVIIP